MAYVWKASVTHGQVNFGYLIAGSVVSLIPCVALYVALQRYYVQGLAAGALKSWFRRRGREPGAPSSRRRYSGVAGAQAAVDTPVDAGHERGRV
jgi:hypothetical protein